MTILLQRLKAGGILLLVTVAATVGLFAFRSFLAEDGRVTVVGLRQVFSLGINTGDRLAAFLMIGAGTSELFSRSDHTFELPVRPDMGVVNYGFAKMYYAYFPLNLASALMVSFLVVLVSCAGVFYRETLTPEKCKHL